MTTTNLGMTIPTVGADADTWGNELNANLNIIDAFSKRISRQVKLSGTAATYNTPANCRQLRIRMVGGGGGGGPYNGGVAGGGGGDTSFNSVVAKGGSGGGVGSASIGTSGRGGRSGTGTVSFRVPGAS